jgi:6-phosphogluconolactonase
MKKQIQFIALVAAATALTFSSCKKTEDNISPQSSATGTPDYSERGANPDEADLSTDAIARHANGGGYLYTEGNEAGTNQIHIYKQHGDGHLTHEGAVASGGAGNNMGLGSQGALALSDNNEWLFAVNAGANSVSSFKVHNDGSLTLTDTKASGGTTPVSLCIYHRYLYVVNSGSSNICGYEVGAGGTLTTITGSNLPLSANAAGPAQIAFSPNGEYLYVTEKMTNMITSFEVDASGLATSDMSFPSTGVTPFGFSIARDNYMVVSNANAPGGMGLPNASSCTSYSGINPGNLHAVNGAVANNQTAACWVATTKYGRFAYVANTGSDNISSYYVSPWGGIYVVHAVSASAGDAPADIAVAANNYYVYNINGMSHSISGYHRAFLGDLVANGTITGLPDHAAGLVAW